MGDSYLGPGIRVGFMGMLHSEVFRARLEEELGVESLITSPKVVYRVEFPKDKRLHSSREGEVIEIEDLGLWPEGQKIKVRVVAVADSDAVSNATNRSLSPPCRCR